MEIYGYTIIDSDVVINLGSSFSGCFFCGLKKDSNKEVVIGTVKNSGIISIPKSIFNNFCEFKVDGVSIELAEGRNAS